MTFLSLFSLTGKWPNSGGHGFVITLYFLLSHLNSYLPSSLLLFKIEALKLTQCLDIAITIFDTEFPTEQWSSTVWNSRSVILQQHVESLRVSLGQVGGSGAGGVTSHCKSTSCVTTSCVVYIMNPCPSPCSPARASTFQPHFLQQTNEKKSPSAQPHVSASVCCSHWEGNWWAAVLGHHRSSLWQTTTTLEPLFQNESGRDGNPPDTGSGLAPLQHNTSWMCYNHPTPAHTLVVSNQLQCDRRVSAIHIQEVGSRLNTLALTMESNTHPGTRTERWTGLSLVNDAIWSLYIKIS